MKFINQFFQDVINDYEKSVIGTFTKNLLDQINNDDQLRDTLEVYFTITKFENDIGFSLIHQESDDNQQFNKMDDLNNQDITQGDGGQAYFNQTGTNLDPIAENNKGSSPKNAREEIQRQVRKAQLTKHGVIPEFIKITEIYKVYTAFTQANLKNSILHQK